MGYDDEAMTVLGYPELYSSSPFRSSRPLAEIGYTGLPSVRVLKALPLAFERAS
jgi:hypothetical protein